MTKKRFTALLVSLLTAVALVPFSAFSAGRENGTDIVNGYYDGQGKWNAGGTGEFDFSAPTLSLSKKAEASSDGSKNKYDITLRIKAWEKRDIRENATVLIFDLSGSMEGKRLDRLKEIANEYIDSYGRIERATNGYLSIVIFSNNAEVILDWKDMTVEQNRTDAKNVIKKLEADGGTNLDASLYSAVGQFGKDTVKNVSKDYRFTVVLTDGAPTYARNESNTANIGSGSGGSETIVANTAATAVKLREISKVYTVCFGAASHYTYEEHEWWDIFGISDAVTYGPTVGDFLRDSIAGTPDCAYNADNENELANIYTALYNAFNAVETEGGDISGCVVTDTLPDGVTVTDAPENFITEDGKIYKWTLGDPEKETSPDGKTKTYTYTLKYTVKIDTTADGYDDSVYHPLNGNTSVTAWDKTYDFPVPGVKGETPAYKIIFRDGDHGEITSGQAEQILKHGEMPVPPAVTADGGWYFAGWTPEVTKVTGDREYTAKYLEKVPIDAKRKTVETGADNEWTVSYNANTYSYTLDDIEFTGLREGDTVDRTQLSFDLGGLYVGTYTADISGTLRVTDANGADVTEQYVLDDITLKLIIEPAKLIITAADAEKMYDGTPLTPAKDGYTQIGLFGNDTVTDIELSGSLTDAGTADVTPSDAVIGNGGVDVTENYDIIYLPGKLTVKEAGEVVVFITGNTAEYEYDGKEHEVTGYTVRIEQDNGGVYSENDFICSRPASAAGTDEGSYNMGLREGDFENLNGNLIKVTFVVSDGGLTIRQKEAKPVDATPDITDGSDPGNPSTGDKASAAFGMALAFAAVCGCFAVRKKKSGADNR